MAQPSLDLDDFLCFALHSTAQAVIRANKPMLDELDLTYPQYLVMVVLWGEDNQTVGGIGDKLLLESSTLTPLLKRLEASGLVRRARCAEDERQVRVSLTEQGKAPQDQARKHRPTWVERAFGDDPEGARVLRESVTTLRQRLLASQEAP